MTCSMFNVCQMQMECRLRRRRLVSLHFDLIFCHKFTTLPLTVELDVALWYSCVGNMTLFTCHNWYSMLMACRAAEDAIGIQRMFCESGLW